MVKETENLYTNPVNLWQIYLYVDVCVRCDDALYVLVSEWCYLKFQYIHIGNYRPYSAAFNLKENFYIIIYLLVVYLTTNQQHKLYLLESKYRYGLLHVQRTGVYT